MDAQYEYLNQILILAVMAGSLNLLMGVAGQPSLAHPALAAVGGYAAALISIHQEVAWPIAVVLGVLAGAVGSLLLALPALRLTSEYVILLTLAALYIVQSLASAIPFFGGGQGLYGMDPMSAFGEDLTTTRLFLPVSLIGAAVALLVCTRLSRSPYGRALRGLREDEGATQSLGKNTGLMRLSAFGVTGGFAGLAGVLVVYYAGFVTPQQFTTHSAIQLFTVIILGGSGNILGSLLGAVIVVELGPLLEDVLSLDPIYAGQVQQILYGALLVLFILVRPEGVLPERLGRVRRTGVLLPATDTRAPAVVEAATPEPPLESASVARHVSTVADERQAVGRSSVQVVERAVDVDDEHGREVLHRAIGDDDLSSTSTDGVRSATSAPPLVVRGLRKSFGSIKAVNGVDLDIERGRLTSLIGPNGAGKTTLFSLWTGFIRPDAGSIKLQGREIVGDTPDRIARMGLVRSFQDVRLFMRLSVVDNVRIAVPDQPGESALGALVRPRASNQGDERTTDQALNALEFVGLAEKANDPVGELAYAEQKLLGLARSLATGADVLLLDEPTSGIDPDALGRIAALIRSLSEEAGKTVCVVEHNLNFLELLGGGCYFLEAGAVTAQGTLRDLMADRRLREAYFGV